MAEQKLVFKIQGMDCSEEVSALKQEVGPLVGGAERLSFDVLTGRMTVRVPGGALSPGAVEKAVARTGMQAEPWREDRPEPDDEAKRLRDGRGIATMVSGLSTALAFAAHAVLRGGAGAALGIQGTGIGHEAPVVSIVLYGVAVVAGLWYVAPRAWLAVRRLRSDMNLLMTVAILGALVLGEYFEAATVAFLFTLSLALESWSLGRARRAIAALLDLAPPVARVLGEDGRETEIPVADVPVGSRIVVRPGERVPLDGTIVQGTTAVNEAPITGESMPRVKGPGAELFAGTINGGGAVVVETTRQARDTVLARIIRMVGEAQERRAPAETWVDGFARVYTPAVMFAAAATAVLPPALAGQSWEEWIYRALVLLVIACPCALVISTPVSIVASLAASARSGVLVKGGLFAEIPARLNAIALDKTGTITRGEQRVAEIVAWNGWNEKDLLRLAASLEARSGHPIAGAITTHSEREGVPVEPAAQVQDDRGRGVSGEVDGTAYWAGSHRFLEEKGIETAGIHEQLLKSAAGGKTVVVVGNDTEVLGMITLEDGIRPDAAQVVSELHALGIRRVVMLTGDNRETAEAVAAAVGIDDVRAELLPENKVEAVEALSSEFHPIAMVGDGVNDAPAMAIAGLGIAMGAAGSDAAIETADIALMSDDLTRIPWLIRHAKRTLRIIRENIVFALAVKAVFVILTFAGHASLWAAIAADMGASLLVIGNGLRLLSDRSSGYTSRGD